jgi:hypothetical protein
MTKSIRSFAFALAIGLIVATSGCNKAAAPAESATAEAPAADLNTDMTASSASTVSNAAADTTAPQPAPRPAPSESFAGSAAPTGPLPFTEPPQPKSASPASAAPAPAAAPTSDEIKAQLHIRNIRYNKPSAISFDSDTPISLVVEMAGAGSGQAALANMPGGQVAAVVKLSDKVTAVLTGPPDDVSIVQADPPSDRTLEDGFNAQWIWNVRAKQPGTALLTLEVSTTVQRSGSSVPVQIVTYTDKFPVQISVTSWLKWQIDRIDPIWKWLGLGTPIAIIGGGIAWWRARRKSGPSPASGA